jgi:hypothetical protein
MAQSGELFYFNLFYFILFLLYLMMFLVGQTL